MSQDVRTRHSRFRDPSSILVLRSETPRDRELFALFHRLSPADQEGVLAQLREAVRRTTANTEFERRRD